MNPSGNRYTPIPSRREMIQRLGGGLGALGLAGVLPHLTRGTTSESHFAPRAKRVIQLFMNGGPFQADLFDPKPPEPRLPKTPK